MEGHTPRDHETKNYHQDEYRYINVETQNGWWVYWDRKIGTYTLIIKLGTAEGGDKGWISDDSYIWW